MATNTQPINKNPLANTADRVVQYEYESPFDVRYVLLTATQILVCANTPYASAKTGDILFTKQDWWSVRKREENAWQGWNLQWYYQYFRNPPPIIEALRLVYF